jgi:hypothetical protein
MLVKYSNYFFLSPIAPKILELYQKCPPIDNGSDENKMEREFDEGSVGGNYITEKFKTKMMQSATQLTLT